MQQKCFIYIHEAIDKVFYTLLNLHYAKGKKNIQSSRTASYMKKRIDNERRKTLMYNCQYFVFYRIKRHGNN